MYLQSSSDGNLLIPISFLSSNSAQDLNIMLIMDYL